MSEPRICEVGGGDSGVLLPGGDWSAEWPQGVKILIFFMGLVWCFMGVSIVCDIFMGAIERITAQKKRIASKSNPEHLRTVKVWNDTVANLTLMALGSSAPEILLSVIELFKGKFYSGKLGPSTIVGSAAFNLLCIIAVCVAAIPAGEERKIKDTTVFLITASCSIFAYLWLLFILTGPSPDIIDIWEGVMTFLFFPVLVLTAYLADIGTFSHREGVTRDLVIWSELSLEELASLETKIRQQSCVELTEDEVTQIMEREYAAPASRAAHRVAATRSLTGGFKVKKSVKKPESEKMATNSSDTAKDRNLVEFSAAKYAVIENVGTVNISVLRKGDPSSCMTVAYRTKDGTAKAGHDYEHVEGKLVFQPNDTVQHVAVKIVNDVEFEQDDEEFFIELIDLECSGNETVIGDLGECKVVIIDDDGPGVLQFATEEIQIQEEPTKKTTIQVVVKRLQGSGGEVSCKYRTEDDTAKSGHDFTACEGKLVFKEGQMSAHIELEILPRGRYERTELFRLLLEEPDGGVTFKESTDGGEDCCILTCVIKPAEGASKRVDKMLTSMHVNWDQARLGTSNWGEQLRRALYANGGREEQKEAHIMDWIMHIVTLPWKLLFALVPPADFANGWVCFCCSLIMVGFVTAIIGDMASLLGCALNIEDEITAITFVALGTSLPDTFASKSAAVEDPYADASVGNVTGSNSVNVFLGLGLPWTIGALYWKFIGATEEWSLEYMDISTDVNGAAYDWKSGGGDARFVVRAGTLGFSVTVFSICALVCLLTLAVRRAVCGAELGGSNVGKYSTAAFFFSLWCFYIAMSSWSVIQNSEKDA